MENPLTVATEIADGKISKFNEVALLPALTALGITDARFQLLLEQEKDIQLRTNLEKLLRLLNAEVMESETIPVDYDELNAVVKAFDDNKFGSKWVHLDLATIQVAGSGKVGHKVFEWHPNRIVYNREIWPQEKLAKLKPGYKFADFLTALKYALKLPDRQLGYSLIILFELDGRLCCLFLDRYDGRRHVRVRRCDLGGGWREGVRFLLVRE